MGNENERKHDPAENRQERMGHPWDDVKHGGDERNVGLTGDAGSGSGGVTGSSAGTSGVVGGSSDFLAGQAQDGSGETRQDSRPSSQDENIGQDTKQVLTGDQRGSGNFSGQPQGGTSAVAANNSRADLGASGAGASGEGRRDTDSPQVGPGGQSEIGGASDLGGGETGLGDKQGFIGSGSEEDSADYLEKDGNPQAGFAERGRGAPNDIGAGPEGSPQRTDNETSEIEGSSSTR